MLHRVAARNLLRNRRRFDRHGIDHRYRRHRPAPVRWFSSRLIKLMLTGYVRMMGHVIVQHEDFFEYGSGNPAQYSIEDAMAV